MYSVTYLRPRLHRRLTVELWRLENALRTPTNGSRRRQLVWASLLTLPVFAATVWTLGV